MLITMRTTMKQSNRINTRKIALIPGCPTQYNYWRVRDGRVIINLRVFEHCDMCTSGL